MGQILLYLLLGGTAIAAIMRPWIGVMAAYVFVILGPQHIWWWNFTGVRPFFIVAIPTALGILLAIGRKEIDFSFLKTKINLLLLILFIFTTISYLFGPYVHGGPGPHWDPPEVIYDRIWKSYFFYFMAVLCINDEKKLKYLSLVMVGSIIYLIYWANIQYLSGHWYGRLGGPRSTFGGHFIDENGFAMLFVMGLPFLYYWGCYCKKTVFRYGLWLIIPFGWHAIFLTGSRGGLLGLAVTILVMSIRSPQKWLGMLMIPALIFAFQWQAGDVMRSRADTLQNVEEVSSAQTRFQAWDAAWKMMLDHPVTGVGLTGMGPAFPVYSIHEPRVAHNAYFQTGAESGMVAFLAYIGVFFLTIKLLWKRTDAHSDNLSELSCLLSEALLVAILGFAVCATFLSINNNEIFFYLILLANFIYMKKKGNILPVNSRSV